MSLNAKQERFCQEYAKGPNGRNAAIAAGYSEKTADSKASQLLRIVKVKDRINELNCEIAKEIKLEVIDIVKELMLLGFSNIQDYFEEGFEMKDIVALERSKAAAIESVTITTSLRGHGDDQYTERTVKFKLYSKTNALDMLAKHKGLYEKDNQQKQPVTIPELTPEQRQKFKDEFNRKY